MSYYINGGNYQGLMFEGEFNGKFYNSKLPKSIDGPICYRVYVDNKMYHITDNEKKKIELMCFEIDQKYNTGKIDNTYKMLFEKVMNKIKSVSKEEAIIIMNDILHIKYEKSDKTNTNRWDGLEL